MIVCPALREMAQALLSQGKLTAPISWPTPAVPANGHWYQQNKRQDREAGT